MRNTPDKRYFIRLKTNTFSIEYKIADTNGVFSARVINISAGGICFLRESILEKGDILQIKFPFKSKKIILTAEVIRIEGREVAVKFLDDERQIEKFVENFNLEFLGIKAKNDKNYKLVNEKEISNEDEKEKYSSIFYTTDDE
jgi:hypothetical protein